MFSRTLATFILASLLSLLTAGFFTPSTSGFETKDGTTEDLPATPTMDPFG